MINHYEENTQGTDYVVSDIHGQYDLLMRNLREIGFNKKADRLFSVGDLIDRGPRSHDCLSLVYEPWFHAVRGNHEMLAYAALNKDDRMDLWLMNGGMWGMSYDQRELRSLVNDVLTFMPYAIEVKITGKKVGIVHAEPPHIWSLIETHGQSIRQELVWSRTKISNQDSSSVEGINAVICGHTIVDSPVQLGNVHFIDTGAFHTGRLTIRKLSSFIEEAINA